MHHTVNPIYGFAVLATIGIVVMLPFSRRGWRRGRAWVESRTVMVGLVCVFTSVGLLALLDYHRFRGVVGFSEALAAIFAFVGFYLVGLVTGLGGLAAAFGAAARHRGQHTTN